MYASHESRSTFDSLRMETSQTKARLAHECCSHFISYRLRVCVIVLNTGERKPARNHLNIQVYFEVSLCRHSQVVTLCAVKSNERFQPGSQSGVHFGSLSLPKLTHVQYTEHCRCHSLSCSVLSKLLLCRSHRLLFVANNVTTCEFLTNLLHKIPVLTWANFSPAFTDKLITHYSVSDDSIKCIK